MDVEDRIDGWVTALEGFAASVGDGSLMRDALSSREEILLDIQREQLMAGKAADGGPIRPTYSEDPYFRTREAMERYRGWKHRLNPRRDIDAPDLFITGEFHSDFFLSFLDDGVLFDNYWKEVFDKYGAEQFGLTDENWDEVLSSIREEVNTHLHSVL